MDLTQWKIVAEMVYYGSAILAALGALFIYRRNSRLERARWLSTLYDKFFESDRYKEVRDILDTIANTDRVNELVIKEEAKFTDYLNFFEFVAILTVSKQLRHQEVDDLFNYYLECLKRHDRVREYISREENGYERLRKLLGIKK
ncbi:MAG: hypothetical protein L0229_14095 [Blastocatellia bacterium]|nr:hypothetical protein [Blastocatellia bacterium]